MDDEGDGNYSPASAGENAENGENGENGKGLTVVEHVGYDRDVRKSNEGDDGNNDYEEDIVKEEDDDDDDDDEVGGNGVQRISKDDYGDGDEGDDGEDGDLQKHPKKRKLKNLLASYEFAPRVPAPSSVAKQSYGGRNPLTDWTQHETFVLLDAWGDRFLKQGKKSLRSEEWQEVADMVSQQSTIERTDTQCRNRLDTLKKKYKKEKSRRGGPGMSANEWVYFKKMDTLLSSSTPQQSGISGGVDSGEHVFMIPKENLSQSSRLDEMRDSPGNSENESEGLPPQRTKKSGVKGSAGCIKLIADSIMKFSKIYEKTENNKRRDMLELEELRMEFRKDLELQRSRILERAQAEIAKIRQGGGDEDNDISADD